MGKLAPNKDGPGVVTPFWVWASAVPAEGKPRSEKPVISQSVAEKGGAANQASSSSTADGRGPDSLDDLLVKHAGISAPTFINLLKAQGFTITRGGEGNGKKKKGAAAPGAESDSEREADTSGANQQFLRARESWVFRSQFIESAASDNGVGPTRFRAVLLQEGLGNLRDGYYYSKEALKSAIHVFDGKKIYADHPSAEEEQTRPERSVRDVLGYFENCAYEEADDGAGRLVADVVVLPDKPYEWARALMRQAVEFSKKHPDKDFIGLSINANGDAVAQPIADFMKGDIPDSAMNKLGRAQEQGLEEIKVVQTLTEAISCDLVTEAGAGGRVVSILESQTGKQGAVLPSKPEMHRKEEAMGKKLKEAADAVEGKKNEAQDPEHKDESQDIELIKQMLDKYLGQEDHAEDTMSQAKEAYQAAIGEGMKKEEAASMVGEAMKCARIMKKKEASKKEADDAAAAAKGGDEGEKKQPPEKKADAKDGEAASGEEAKGDDDGDADDAAPKKEAEVLRLKAENATLRESLAKVELTNYVDQKLAESKLPRETTKKFREACGEFKNKQDFDAKLKVWISAREAVSGEADDLLSFIQPEKTPTAPSGEALSFADCVK